MMAKVTHDRSSLVESEGEGEPVQLRFGSAVWRTFCSAVG